MVTAARHDHEREMFARAAATPLLRSALLMVHDRPTAEDLVQSTLERTLGHWIKARHAPHAYARQVLVNLVRDRWRRSRTQPEHPSGSLLQPPNRTGGSVVPLWRGEDQCFSQAVVERAPVVAALGQLPDRQRAAIVLRFYLDCTVPEIADVLAVPAGTVKSDLSRATAALRTVLEPWATNGTMEVPADD